jgi:hypothetical protein
MADEREGLRLEDWIGEWVTVSLLMEPADTADERIVQIEGFLEGVDPMGIIVLFGRGDVHMEPRPGRTQPDVPRHVFYPWRRIQLVERIKGV